MTDQSQRPGQVRTMIREDEKIFLQRYVEGETSFEDTLLVASSLGLDTDIKRYSRKIDKLEKEFRAHDSIYGRREEHILRRLYNFLDKNGSLERDLLDDGQASFLTDVLDSVSKKYPTGIGDCLGLTSLFTVLGQRVLDPMIDKSLHIYYQSQDFPHVLSGYRVGGREMYIENTEPGLFDDDPEEHEIFGDKLVKGNLRDLVSLALSNKGTLFPKSSQDGKVCYSLALELSPENPRAHYHMGLNLLFSGDLKKALTFANSSLAIDESYREAHKLKLAIYNGLEDSVSADKQRTILKEIPPTFSELIE